MDHKRLDQPAKDRVNGYLRDAALQEPVVGYVYDIIKWIEWAEKEARRKALVQARNIQCRHCRDGLKAHPGKPDYHVLNDLRMTQCNATKIRNILLAEVE